MSAPKHDPPMYRPVILVRDGEVHVPGADGGPDEVIATLGGPVFSIRSRSQGDRAAGYDVLDEFGDAIGFFRQDADGATSVHGPYGLDATGGSDLDLRQDGRPVLAVEDGTVTIPDPRVDFRLAAAIAVALEAPNGEH